MIIIFKGLEDATSHVATTNKSSHQNKHVKNMIERTNARILVTADLGGAVAQSADESLILVPEDCFLSGTTALPGPPYRVTLLLNHTSIITLSFHP